MINTPSNSIPLDVLEGVVDGLTGNVLRGWACSHDTAPSQLHVEVRAEGILLGSGAATMFRADLAHAGKGDGHCAFAVTLDPIPEAGAVLTVIAVGANGVQPLVGSPFTMPDHDLTSSSTRHADILPLPIGLARLQGSLDQCGPDRLHGWARWLDGTNVSPVLSLYEGDHEWLRFDANQWRPDISEIHQGDGCCGFDVLLPEGLRDDRLHVLELRITEADAILLKAPFHARIPSASMNRTPGTSTSPAPLVRDASSDKVTLSVIVNFYNMRREAARTLASLSSDYQIGSDALDYEVLCVDNGSDPPLEAEWVASFGPQFRLIRPSRQLSSPCAALNEAALMARGKYVAVMIDGAHVLTPGTFREALQAWREHPDAVVALRQWFIGGDQRWLTLVGYTREQEDQLFERIRWPLNGYDLFRIGSPMSDNPEPWFDGITETNCLMLPTALYDRIGGFDEGFDQAGGGFANLDLWRRASTSAAAPLVALVGEASFHQFHGGTTTNVDDLEKDLRVRSYANAYRTLRGGDFVRVERGSLTFRGHMSSEFATGMRQRTLMPMHLGVTEQIRPGRLSAHFDDGAQSHLMSVYAECDLKRDVRWLGLPTGVAPADLVSIQEIIHQIRPDAVIAVGAEAGLVGFIDNTLQAVDIVGARILHVTNSATSTTRSSRMTSLHVRPDDPATVTYARDWAGGAETVLVLHAVDSTDNFSPTTLQTWGQLVSHRSFLICLGTVFGQPWLGYSNRQHFRTIREFATGNSPFVIDRSWTRQLVSTCPYGYLRKVGGNIKATQYDAALDDIAPDQQALLENPQ
ncbi:CmcI family methyltransferase [Rhodanobacter sp. A1T4]|uniref:CmcI family methyltransferase n=1 Tax=Rhodanobacter sp. A1T4 TaxID=2723087 RepID=UPI00161B9450|nr:CmcI family methyltransferase [Rhodanobacter sp. A1T4]MBB6245206.1 cephalosporin hydroxylase [Rhodanobacter sp. A1T4]